MLTKAEKQLIERELISREHVRVRRKKFFDAIFWVGLAFLVLAAVSPVFLGKSLVPHFFRFGYLLCLFLYIEAVTIPRTFSQDIDPQWHLNPWQDILQRLSSEDRQIKAIILLAAPFALRVIVFSIVFLCTHLIRR